MAARVVKHGFSKFRAMLTQHTTSDLKVKKRYGHVVNHLKSLWTRKLNLNTTPEKDITGGSKPPFTGGF
jgi:hypothetical protein